MSLARCAEGDVTAVAIALGAWCAVLLRLPASVFLQPPSRLARLTHEASPGWTTEKSPSPSYS
jgi:hypothetical protein